MIVALIRGILSGYPLCCVRSYSFDLTPKPEGGSQGTAKDWRILDPRSYYAARESAAFKVFGNYVMCVKCREAV